MNEASTFYETLLNLRQQRPFRPFVIVLKDGRRYEVSEFDAFATNGKTVVVTGVNEPSRQLAIDSIQEIIDAELAKDPEQERVRRELSSFLRRKPFAPFAILLKDGTKHSITRRFQAAIGETTAFCVNTEETKHSLFRLREVQEIQQVASS